MNRIVVCASLLFCSMFTVFPETLIISDVHTAWALTGMVMLESEVDEGRNISVDPVAAGFIPYSGSPLSEPAATGAVRMFTFRQQFTVEGGARGKDLYVVYGPLEYPMNIYLNGSLIERIGRHVDGYESIFFSTGKTLLPPALLRQSGENEIGFEIFPIRDRVPMKNLFITGFRNASAMSFTRTFFNHRFEQYTVAVSAFIAVFFMFLFFSTRFRLRKYLISSLLALSFAVGYSIFFIDEGSDELTLLRIARIGTFLVSGFLGLYVIEETGLLRKRWFMIPYTVFTMAVPPLILMFAGTKYAVNSTFTFLSNFTITPILIMSMILVLVSAVRDRNPRLLPLFGSLAAIAFCGIHDLGYLSRNDIPNVWLVIYGYFLLLLVIFFQLSIEQSRIYFSSVESEKRLAERNESLSTILSEIKNVTETLTNNSRLLETSVREASEITDRYRKINHEVKERILSRLESIDRIIMALTQRMQSFLIKIPEAIGNQNTAIETASRNVESMNAHIEEVLDRAIRANTTAEMLHELSFRSSDVVRRSKLSIEKISAYSKLIRDFVTAIEDISEKTGVLSINASIESARAGAYGKGFGVVAGEIRNLAAQTKKNMDESLSRLQDMFRTIDEGMELSGDTSSSLEEILEKTAATSSMMKEIQDHLREQREESSAVMASTSRLLDESRAMLRLTGEEKAENDRVTGDLRELVQIFGSVTELLNTQEHNETRFSESVNNIRSVLDRYMKSIEVLSSLQQSEVPAASDQR